MRSVVQTKPWHGRVRTESSNSMRLQRLLRFAKPDIGKSTKTKTLDAGASHWVR